jgi:hypothetical protein
LPASGREDTITIGYEAGDFILAMTTTSRTPLGMRTQARAGSLLGSIVLLKSYMDSVILRFLSDRSRVFGHLPNSGAGLSREWHYS